MLPIFLSENEARLEYHKQSANRIFPLSLSSGLIDEANEDDHHNLCIVSNASVPIDLYEHASLLYNKPVWKSNHRETTTGRSKAFPCLMTREQEGKAVSVGEWSALTLASINSFYNCLVNSCIIYVMITTNIPTKHTNTILELKKCLMFDVKCALYL